MSSFSARLWGVKKKKKNGGPRSTALHLVYRFADELFGETVEGQDGIAAAGEDENSQAPRPTWREILSPTSRARNSYFYGATLLKSEF